MVIPVSKPRNPFGVGTGMAKAGSHGKSQKAQRHVDNKAARDAAKKMAFGGSSDDFSP